VPHRNDEIDDMKNAR